MNRWYPGYIEGYLVEVFLSDDYALDYFLPQSEDCTSPDCEYPPRVLEACERIRGSNIRSLSGAQKVLRDNGWSNA